MWTSISGAIDFSAPLFDDNGFAGERRVIDVSGDGVNNRGRLVTQARDEAVARGIVINGLPILNDRSQPMGMPTPMEIALDRYYAESVIGGPGSFVVPATGLRGVQGRDPAEADPGDRRERAPAFGPRSGPRGPGSGSLDELPARRETMSTTQEHKPGSSPREHAPKKPDEPARDEQAIDEAVDDFFPASDPPAFTSDTGAGSPDGKPRKP